MEIQAAPLAPTSLVFDEVPRSTSSATYTARSTERTHPLAAPLPGLASRARPGGPARLRHRAGRRLRGPARRSAQAIAASECDGIAIGGSLGADKPEMYQVVEWTTKHLPEDRPRHLLGIGEIDDLVRGVELGIDTFNCAMPSAGRHGMVLVPDPEARWRVDLTKSRWKTPTSR